MTEFNDIKWKKHRIGAGIQGELKLKNGWEISLVAGEGFYSTPGCGDSISTDWEGRNHNQYTSFEVAIINPNGNIEGDVLGWQCRQKIDKLIKKLN